MQNIGFVVTSQQLLVLQQPSADAQPISRRLCISNISAQCFAHLVPQLPSDGASGSVRVMHAGELVQDAALEDCFGASACVAYTDCECSLVCAPGSCAVFVVYELCMTEVRFCLHSVCTYEKKAVLFNHRRGYSCCFAFASLVKAADRVVSMQADMPLPSASKAVERSMALQRAVQAWVAQVPVSSHSAVDWQHLKGATAHASAGTPPEATTSADAQMTGSDEEDDEPAPTAFAIALSNPCLPVRCSALSSACCAESRADAL